MIRQLILAVLSCLILFGPASGQTSPRPSERLAFSGYEVMGPPTGAAAEDFITALRPVLAEHVGVAAAYLHWVQYEDVAEPSVALLLVAPQDAATADAIGRTFARIFSMDQHLDVIFLQPEEEAALEARLVAIYSRPDRP